MDADSSSVNFGERAGLDSADALPSIPLPTPELAGGGTTNDAGASVDGATRFADLTDTMLHAQEVFGNLAVVKREDCEGASPRALAVADTALAYADEVVRQMQRVNVTPEVRRPGAIDSWTKTVAQGNDIVRLRDQLARLVAVRPLSPDPLRSWGRSAVDVLGRISNNLAPLIPIFSTISEDGAP